jgi:hypothetical protein
MKQVGSCEHCSKTGVLETIEVTRIGTTSSVVSLRLCERCITVPSATWRRQYQPVSEVSKLGWPTGIAASRPNI